MPESQGASSPLDHDPLIPLRAAAALLVAVPELRVRFRDGERFLAEIGTGPVDPVAGPQIRSSIFRADVVRLHQGRRPGAHPSLSASGPAPAIDYALPGGRVLPGGILRVRRNRIWHQVAAVTFGPDTWAAVAEGLDLTGLLVRTDAELDVTLVGADTATEDRHRTWQVLDRLEAVLARCTVTDLEARLAAPHRSAHR
jgi:hypothetical protein